MTTVRRREIDILHDRDAFLDHVARSICLVRSAINHGERGKTAMFEQDQHRHREKPVDLAGDTRKGAAAPLLIGKLDGEEDEESSMIEVR